MSLLFSVSGKLPPGKSPPIKLPLVNSPPENSHPENLTRNIPTHVFKYSHPLFKIFSLLSPLSLILLKQLFCNSVLKVRLIVVLKKRSLPANIVTYSKKFCWSSMIIGHYYIHLFALELFILEAEECNVTQFNQINLNSSFSIGLLINWLTWLIYLQK